MSESLLRNFKYLTIPSCIWLRKDLSIQARALWAELHSLHNEERDGCFASDEYLMEFMGLQRRRLYELYKELKDKNLLKVTSNGRTSIRKALMPSEEMCALQKCTIPHSRSAEKCTADMQNSALPPYIEERKDNKDIHTPKIPIGSHVKLKQEDLDKLYKDHGKKNVDEMIETMNDYCLSKNPKGYNDYAATLRNWFRKESKNKSQGKNENPKDSIRRRQLDEYEQTNGSFDDCVVKF